MPKVLIIDDEEKLRKLLARIIELEGHQVLQAANAQKAAKIIQENMDILLVLTDVKLPDAYGIDLIEKFKIALPCAEIVVMTAYGTIQDGVKAMKLGAFDYITKGDNDAQIIVTIEKALEKAQLQQKLADLEKQIKQIITFDKILGKSKKIQQTISLAQKVAPTDAVVLLEGETGTGKELFAQALHHASPRKNKKLVAVNCSAFPKDLLESEMFGHKKGAFTGAFADKKGLFEEADGGTLFLDEIGEMPLELQAKLLRVLENKTFIKTGETKVTQVDVRIIAATNRNLLEEIEKEHFRADLYYRLSVFKLQIPSLKERLEDLELLSYFFLNEYKKMIKKNVLDIDPLFLEKLKSHDWKGNIRELRNLIERAVILCETQSLTPDLLPLELNQKNSSSHFTENDSMQALEKQHITKILRQTAGNKTEAAKILNIGLATLYRKIEEYGI